MSNDLNQWNGIGRLGKDPETRYTSSGSAVTSFSIACGWKSKEKEGVEWVSITAFGKLAEICGEYLVKGKQVFIQGRMTTDKYEKDGITRYSTKIIADRMQMLGGNDGQRSAPAVPVGTEPTGHQPKPSAGEFVGDDPSDIPF